MEAAAVIAELAKQGATFSASIIFCHPGTDPLRLIPSSLSSRGTERVGQLPKVPEPEAVETGFEPRSDSKAHIPHVSFPCLLRICSRKQGQILSDQEWEGKGAEWRREAKNTHGFECVFCAQSVLSARNFEVRDVVLVHQKPSTERLGLISKLVRDHRL